jgi:nucleoside-diphosphate-sugar epimerase
LRELKFDYYLHVSTVAVYQKSEQFPLNEKSSLGTWPCWGDYNVGKVASEQAVRATNIPHAIIRPVYILGTENHVPREEFMYRKIAHEEKIMLPGNGQAIVQFTFVDDVVNAMVQLVEKKTGGAFNCAGDELITLKGLVEMMAEIVGGRAHITYNPATDGIYHNETEFPFANEHMVCSNAKIKRLGVTFTPLEEGLRADYESYYKNLCI